MKNKIFWAVLVVALAAAAYFFSGKPQPTEEEKPTNKEQKSETKNENGQSQEEGTGNTLIGTLRASNDKKRGNLMLELSDSDRVIYMTTSRDFASLYGKEVAVSIDGDLNGFTLVDIKAK